MAAPAIPVANGDVVQVKVYCQATEQVSQNVLGYVVSGVLGGGITLQDIANDVDTAVEAAYKALIFNTAFYYGVEARKFVAGRLSLANFTKGNVGLGTAGAAGMGRQLAGMFTKQSLLPGLAGRGRFYAPFPASADTVDDGVPTAGYMLRLGVLAAILQAPVAVAGLGTGLISPVLIRYPRPAAVPPVTLGTTPWGFALARVKWATHRSRGSYGRPNAVPF